MRRSTEVPLTLLAALALFTTGPSGCKDTPEIRNCVDAQGRIVPEANCQAHSSGGSGGYGYRYLYGGSSGGHVGDAVVGGSTESGVSRGGFGHAGGEGGGEGGE